MGRTSRRNFLTLFRAIDVDDATRGPEVSEDIQLVYIADDLRQTASIDAGAGGNEAAVVGEHAIVTLECRNPGGVEITQVTMSISIPANGTVLRAWTSGVQPVITGIATMVAVLRTTGLQGLPAAPVGASARGTILTAAIPGDTFQWVDVHQFDQPFFINQGQHFNVACAAANLAMSLGIRWRELRLFP